MKLLNADCLTGIPSDGRGSNGGLLSHPPASPAHFLGHLKYRKGDFPVSEAISQRIFSVPMHPYLSAADQEQICQIMMESLKS